MEKIGRQAVWSYFEDTESARSVSNHKIRSGVGHRVHTFFELARKVAELQFLNREHVLLFRGQSADYRTTKGNSMLKASLFRNIGNERLIPIVLQERFALLRQAEVELVADYAKGKFKGVERLRRHRIIRWAILQHYEICKTPLLDVTQSLRIAASFATQENPTNQAFVFVLGVPNLSGAVTASSEASLQIVRLSSACPPEAVRPHLQEGYLLGEYPEISDYEQSSRYGHYEMDFGQRLVAKFRFDPQSFWNNPDFPPASERALYPVDISDPLIELTRSLQDRIRQREH